MSASFHISIGWTLTEPSRLLVDALNSNSLVLQALEVEIASAKVKVGNSITSISLTSKVDTTNKIIETYNVDGSTES